MEVYMKAYSSALEIPLAQSTKVPNLYRSSGEACGGLKPSLVKSVVDRLSPTMQEARMGCESLCRVMASRAYLR
jgi:hypothetical protein